MAISFTNTVNVGYAYTNGGTVTGTTSVPTIATPSDAANGKLLVGFWAGVAGTGTISAQNASLPNVTGDTSITGSLDALGTYSIDMRLRYAKLTGSPSNCNWNESTGGSRRALGAVLIIDGHDTTTPIRTYSSTPNTGNGTTVTFPDSDASASDGDMVIRWCVIGKEDTALSFSSFTGATTIIDNPESGNFRSGLFVGSDIQSGAGQPGTKAVTLSAARDWKAYTTVVAVAGAASGGGPLVNGCLVNGLLIGSLAR